MVGCDCYWTFDDDEAPAAAGAAQIEINTDRNVLQPAAAADDDAAPAPAPGSPQVDLRDITKWNVLELTAVPITEQISPRRSCDATLLSIISRTSWTTRAG